MLVLSLFPGIGLLDYAFELEGYCTVRGPDVIWGGDIRTFHPPAGKLDGLIGGPPCQSFSSLVHLIRANGYEPTFGNLIPEFERCVAEAEPDWFLMENVRQAPEPSIDGYGVKSFLLDNSALDGGDGHGLEQRRVRRFSFSLRGREAPDLRRWIDLAVFLLPDKTGTVSQWSPNNSKEAKTRKQRHEAVTGGHDRTPSARDRQRQRQQAVTGSDGGASKAMRRYKLADALRLQGLPATHLDHCPMTADGKLKAVANGVPISMGRAIAKAIKCALESIP